MYAFTSIKSPWSETVSFRNSKKWQKHKNIFFVIQRGVLKIMETGKYMLNQPAQKSNNTNVFLKLFLILKYGSIFSPIKITTAIG